MGVVVGGLRRHPWRDLERDERSRRGGELRHPVDRAGHGHRDVGVEQVARRQRGPPLVGPGVGGADANRITVSDPFGHREDPRLRDTLGGLLVVGPGKAAAVGLGVAEPAEAHLTKVARALRPSGRLSRGLHGRQQEPHERRDDRDHDEELDESKSAGLYDATGERRRIQRRRPAAAATIAPLPTRASVVGSGTDWIWFSGMLCDVANAAATA